MKLIRSTADGIEFIAVPFFGDGDGDSRFRIEWERIDGKGKLLRWIKHLSQLPWFTPSMCVDLIDATVARFGWAKVEDLPVAPKAHRLGQ